MLAQAAGFACLAALSPTALLITAVYLGSARPRQTVLCFLAGGLVVATIIGVAALLLLRAGNFQLRGHHQQRDGLRLGLGLLLLAVAVPLARRRPKPPSHAREGSGLVSRLVADPSPVTAVAAGLVVFLPALTFIAAIQVIATARAGTGLTALGMVVVVLIYLALVWLPFLAYLAFPEQTARRLAGFNGWLRRHGRLLLASAMAVAGLIVAVDGLAGLIQKA